MIKKLEKRNMWILAGSQDEYKKGLAGTNLNSFYVYPWEKCPDDIPEYRQNLWYLGRALETVAKCGFIDVPSPKSSDLAYALDLVIRAIGIGVVCQLHCD